MDDQLNKIDIIRERMDVSYSQAKEALDNANGDLVQALIKVEEYLSRGWNDKLLEKGDELVGQIKTYISKGNGIKVRVKQGDRIVAEFPATVGVLGILASLASAELAVFAGVGVVAAAANRFTLEIDKPSVADY